TYLPFLPVELFWIGIIPVTVLVACTHFNKLVDIKNMPEKVLLTGAALIFIVIFSCYLFIFYLPRTFDEALSGSRYFIELFIPISIVLLWCSINEIRHCAARVACLLALFIPIVGASVDVSRDVLVTAIDLVRRDTVSFAEIRKKINRMTGRESLAVD